MSISMLLFCYGCGSTDVTLAPRAVCECGAFWCLQRCLEVVRGFEYFPTNEEPKIVSPVLPKAYHRRPTCSTRVSRLLSKPRPGNSISRSMERRYSRTHISPRPHCSYRSSFHVPILTGDQRQDTGLYTAAGPIHSSG
ncbi:uncharacterized protein BT62DRAFT_737096 [Guyanagaster necrorhizus]|uniref:Secreted protein n=1 Tax=Guyanagaster necrorhizus TaxID=856835 RepID=A0A9P8AM25_9AGAR|nr:uncharacterized protein BT62DRAFT_737096 [Guyanagaster necrorhizus MCA 3950]KAG7439432.1 hypothetical protein BT62DRAFT_737096 [Guyanagaster necrorhizus MCA 3950]